MTKEHLGTAREARPSSKARSLPVGSLISVIIPARNEASRIGKLVGEVLAQDTRGYALEVIVVDDGSEDATCELATVAGARVLRRPAGRGGNPGAARNLGAKDSRGDPIIFLDADCEPTDGWVASLLSVHSDGADVSAGPLGMPSDLGYLARCDYYGSAYHVHPMRPKALVLQHPPCNISVRRSVFFATSGFEERLPVAHGHEELRWQAQVVWSGGRIVFEPRSMVLHHNRPGFFNLLRRNYRWGYSAIPAKAEAGTARFAILYRFQVILIALCIPLAFVATAYVVSCWLRRGIFEPLAMLPVLLAGRLAYGVAMMVGGTRWLVSKSDPNWEFRPTWE